jgi:hypothetical protein
VIEALERGELKSQVCRWLKISRNTLDLWLNDKPLSELVGLPL